MKKYAICGIVTAGFLGAAAPRANAHFNLMYPLSSTAQNATGDPQKTGPCPTGMATNMVTTLKAGETIKVKFNETVPHGGHFRFSIGNPTDMKDPVVSGANCGSAAIENPAKMPTLMDGALVHNAGPPKMWEQDVKIPDNFTCDKCTFQVLQFMNMHATPCFYYHCATVTVTAAAASDGGATDAAVADAAVDVRASGGAGGSTSTGGTGGGAAGTGGASGAAGSGGAGSGSGGSAGSGSGGSSSGSGGSGGSGSGSGGSSGTGNSANSGSSGGCSFGGTATPGGTAAIAGLLVGLVMVARRRRRLSLARAGAVAVAAP